VAAAGVPINFNLELFEYVFPAPRFVTVFRSSYLGKTDPFCYKMYLYKKFVVPDYLTANMLRKNKRNTSEHLKVILPHEH
jgi:hypothetical protein